MPLKNGIGAVLLREHEGLLFPIVLNDDDNFLRWRGNACQLFRCAEVRSDHQPLAYPQKAKFINNRIMRWAMFLQDMEMKIQAIEGK